MITIIPYQNSESDDDEDIISICFSDADEASSYSSTFYSTAASGGSHDDDDQADHHVSDNQSRRDSSASDCSVYVEIFKEENGTTLRRIHLEDDDELIKECRICQLSLGTGRVIELGCDCKNDLALAHSCCAERWFEIRGNRVCEICNSTAENVNIVMELELMQQHSSLTNYPIAGNVDGLTELELMQQHSNAAIATRVVTAQLAAPPPPPPPPAAAAERTDDTIGSFCRGHRLLNFLLACMVFAFVISWLFRFHVTSS